MNYIVTAPVSGFSGTVAGVKFTEGQGITDEHSALLYFRRQGYRVEAEEAKDTPAQAEGPQTQAEAQGTTPAAPSGNANTDTWREHAVARGIPEGTAAELTRAEIQKALANLNADAAEQN